MRDKARKKKHRCQICGEYGVTHIHHIFGGRWRTVSEANDFVIELCPMCHAKAHGNAEFSKALKHDCQMEFLETHSMDEWMELMHRNWVENEIKKDRQSFPELGPFDDIEEVSHECINQQDYR